MPPKYCKPGMQRPGKPCYTGKNWEKQPDAVPCKGPQGCVEKNFDLELVEWAKLQMAYESHIHDLMWDNKMLRQRLSEVNKLILDFAEKAVNTINNDDEIRVLNSKSPPLMSATTFAMRNPRYNPLGM